MTRSVRGGLGWLVTGAVFDDRRFPVVSALVLGGTIVAMVDPAPTGPQGGVGRRAAQLLLFFGRPTLGPALDLLPGADGLFLRRFVSGVHLAGVYLAGIGGAWAGTKVMALVRARAGWIKPAFAAAALVGLLVIAIAPAAAERYSYERTGAGWIAEQRAAQSTDGADFASLVATAKATAPGRIYGGMRANKMGAEDPLRASLRRAAESQRGRRRVHAAHVVAHLERGESVRRTC